MNKELITLQLTTEELRIIRFALSSRTLDLHKLIYAYVRVGLDPVESERESKVISDLQEKFSSLI